MICTPERWNNSRAASGVVGLIGLRSAQRSARYNRNQERTFWASRKIGILYRFTVFLV
jgi:hypothetical protein